MVADLHAVVCVRMGNHGRSKPEAYYYSALPRVLSL